MLFARAMHIKLHLKTSQKCSKRLLCKWGWRMEPFLWPRTRRGCWSYTRVFLGFFNLEWYWAGCGYFAVKEEGCFPAWRDERWGNAALAVAGFGLRKVCAHDRLASRLPLLLGLLLLC